MEADIIILGAGTAGCVLANRLSADPSISVLVLEAGEDRSDDARMYTPALAREMLDNPDFDWGLQSEPEPGLLPLPFQPKEANGTGDSAPGDGVYSGGNLVAEARRGRRMKQPRGKVVGGSSAINSFALIYPSAVGMDAWAELGNSGWDWEGTKDYFRKFCTLVPPDDGTVIEQLNLAHNFSSPAVAEYEGPIHATFPLDVSPLHTAWLNAFRSLGLENLEDPLEGHAVGGGITANHIDGKRRERSHAGIAYLRPVQSRENVTVITGALVQRILFNKGGQGEMAEASGILYEKDGRNYEIKVGKEVILAAGAFGSPQILEMSGIGDSSRLTQHGVDVVYHNPAVGENLQDHIRAGLSYEAAPHLMNTLSKEEAEKLYVEKREGPWAQMAAYMFAYTPLARVTSKEDMQQLETACREHLNNDNNDSKPTPSSFERQHQAFIHNILTSHTEASATTYLTRRVPGPCPIPGFNESRPITLCAMLSHPLSRGSVHITTSNPATHPEIKMNYYTHPLDLEVHARHLLALQDLARTPALASLIKDGGARYPEELTLEKAKTYLRETATTNYHPCGTCAMLPEAMGGVVDAELRVYGTKNLRVVDASVFPVIPRGNIVATVYAVAEKGAEIIGRGLGLDMGVCLD